MTLPRRLADAERDGPLFVREVTAEERRPAALGYVVRAATLADVPRVQRAMQESGDYPADVVVSRLQDGRYPFVVEEDDMVVSYGWVALSGDNVGDMGLSIRLRSHHAYIYDCATHPAYRGRGFYPALLQVMAADLGHGGWSCIWIGTAPGNFTSQHGIVRAGFQRVGDMNLLRRPDGSFRADIYGAPGIGATTLDDAAWSFYATAYPETGLPS